MRAIVGSQLIVNATEATADPGAQLGRDALCEPPRPFFGSADTESVAPAYPNARTPDRTANRFERIGGDAVRVRNRSSSTLIEDNRFIQAGQHGYVGDWYCTASHVARGECSSEEQPSRSVAGANNIFDGLYDGGKPPTARAFCYDIVEACPTSRINIR